MSDTPVSSTREFASLWQLDPSITFLNHGSFGACPRQILAIQQEYRDALEAEPVRFFTRTAPLLLDESRQVLAAFLKGDPLDLVFVNNATSGVNCVLRSLRFEPGDELLTTDHAYLACRNTLEYVAQRDGVKLVVAPLPFPVQSMEQVTDAIVRCATPRTRLAMIDHVTSASGLVLPIADITQQLHSRAIDVLVDGAHAPGMVAINLDALGAAYYTGNLHKWVCAPKGAGFLHVRRDRQQGIMPASISHGYKIPRHDRSHFHDLFDWTGTMDLSPWLCVKDAIHFISALVPGGAVGLMNHNRTLAMQGRRMLCDAFGTEPACPDAMIGSLATVALSSDPNAEAQLDWTTSPTPQSAMQSAMMQRHQIEVPIMYFPKHPQRAVRISAQVYNSVRQYEYLITCLREELSR